ncbi:uncharacterized protein PV09_02429 [Verruconis gallopava]|uniref:Uncharacterized protein n=1 Tax=Verruconis gallopava TaxID=253628 RepID=A0A0D1XVA0_9PEZI|nr:uncharacterized protein PV09_02429 [Verruconis gallopava]KIW06736.1 hypothetical protein PV09_02429 [Verruconis gallopava]
MDNSRPAEYYRGLDQWSLSEGMKDFDDPENYDELARAVMSARSRNFVLDFDDDHAWCGFDLDAEAISSLLKSERPPELNTRWINIWLPHEQKDVLEVLAKHYDFTPRLLGFMQSAPLKQPRSLTNSTKTSLSSFFHRSRNSAESPASDEKPLDRSSTLNSILDPGLNSKELIGMVYSSGASTSSDFSDNLNPYFLANELWHYSSVDWGRKYLCIGYNTIHNVPSKGRTEPADDEPSHEDRPYGKRVWNWLVLCEDRTVISISEDPYPTRNGMLTQHQQVSLNIIRRNLINTFRQLSKARDSSSDPAQMQLPLRKRLGDSEEEAIHRATEVPGMLFYYLFDDWLNTYSLIARKEHRYARELNALRLQMLNRAMLAHIERLHHIGRQLAVLRRVYQSYDMIIDRVLEKQEASLASLKNSKVISGLQSMEQSDTLRPTVAQLDEHHLLGVSISSAARARFARLKHRIRLYALNEINECLDQKESLVLMNFNLIAIKEAFSVERLTEVTLLLAKITMLFMPVSLMSAYFGCQFVDAHFTVASYWKWFAGIFAASVVGLAIFSLASGKLQTKMLVKPLGAKIREKVHDWTIRKKFHEVEDEEKIF